jgi:hypothetical protein
MARFFGAVGYAENVETVPGVWVSNIVERNYYGDIIRQTRKYKDSSSINDDLILGHELSILADPLAYDIIHSIKYVTVSGIKWKVTNITISRPRIILTLGGIYNV